MQSQIFEGSLQIANKNAVTSKLTVEGLIVNKGSAFNTVTLTSNAATLTAAQVVGGNINVNMAAASDLTFPTAAQIIAAIPNPVVGDVYELNIAATGAFILTVDPVAADPSSEPFSFTGPANMSVLIKIASATTVQVF